MLKEYLPKIVDVLAQLLQTEQKEELKIITTALTTLFRRDAKGTLKGLFSQVRWTLPAFVFYDVIVKFILFR